MSRPTKNDHRLLRKRRIRARISGTAERPRMSVFRSLTRISVQLIDDTAGRTIVAASTVEGKAGKAERAGKAGKAGKKAAKGSSMKNMETAKKLGSVIAEKAKKAKIQTVVFDRNAYRYHGRIKALADAAREGGLQF